jgi:uncharacterized SAM-binding protein YcdF (DUF218 family)
MRLTLAPRRALSRLTGLLAGSRLGRRTRALILLPVAGGAVWIGGFVWFLSTALRAPDPPPHADGIVVLTGGAERIETALRLLADGDGRLLLITGAGGGAGEFAGLAHRAGVDAALAARTTLGRAALDTHGNALETAGWAHAHDIGSLIVVTAGYHMPRALAELSRALPEVRLHPYPVLSPVLRNGPDAASLRLLAAEYTKYLAVAARLPIGALRAEERETSGVAKGEERRGG